MLHCKKLYRVTAPPALDAHADITRIRHDAGLGDFDPPPLRIELFEHQIGDAFRERLEQVKGCEANVALTTSTTAA